MPEPPRDFFETYVKPAYHAWEADPSTPWIAKAATTGLHDMAEHVFRYWDKRDQSKVHSAGSANEYRHQLVAKDCDDYALVRDVAEGHKHVELGRKSRRVTRSSQTKEETRGGFFPPNYFPPPFFARGYWGPKPRLVITLDGGNKRDLGPILENVFKMWENLLKSMSL